MKKTRIETTPKIKVKEKIYNLIEKIEEEGAIIYSYIFIYGFAIAFIIIGIVLMLMPANPPEYPKWSFLIIGLPFLIIGCAFLLNAIKYSLQQRY